MKLTNTETREEITPNDIITQKSTGNPYTYKSIVQGPRAIGNNGGPSTGRIMVVDDNGDRLLPDPHPFEFGAIIET